MRLLLGLVALSCALTRAQPDCEASVSVNVTRLERAGQWVAVSWSLDCEGEPADFLALLPCEADIKVRGVRNSFSSRS